MSKPERNDPCHCGSGKKYKKCCMLADEAAVLATIKSSKEEDPEEWEEADPVSDPEWLAPKNMNDNEDDYDGIYKSILSDKSKPGLPIPEISEEDDAFLEKWYEEIQKIENPIDTLNIAIKFIEEYPHLVPAWGFEGEYLLDLISDCFFEGYGEEIFNFLISFRNRFPEIYLRQFGYFDCNLIYYSIVKGKKEDILLYLDYFERFPEAFPDELSEMVNILATIGEDELIFPFLKKIHKQFVNSQYIMGGYRILRPLMFHLENKYMKPDLEDHDYTQLSDEIKNTVEVELDDSYLQPEHWKKLITMVYSEPGIFTCNLNNKKQRDEAYFNFIRQFSRYLFEDVTKNWASVNMITEELTDYITFTIENKNVKKNQYFILSRTVIDKYITQNLKDYIWLDTCKVNALLTGILYFARFLVKTGNAIESDMAHIPETCLELHELEQKLDKKVLESAIFSKFPIY